MRVFVMVAVAGLLCVFAACQGPVAGSSEPPRAPTPGSAIPEDIPLQEETDSDVWGLPELAHMEKRVTPAQGQSSAQTVLYSGPGGSSILVQRVPAGEGTLAAFHDRNVDRLRQETLIVFGVVNSGDTPGDFAVIDGRDVFVAAGEIPRVDSSTGQPGSTILLYYFVDGDDATFRLVGISQAQNLAQSMEKLVKALLARME